MQWKKLDIFDRLLQEDAMKILLHRLRHSSFFQLTVKVLVTLFVFWLVFRNVDFTHLQEVVQRQDHAILAVAALLFFLQMALGAWRWHIIVHALAGAGKPILSKYAAFKIYYISMFFTCCLPGAVGGDVVRAWMAKSEHLPLPVSINSVIIDRIMALVALVIMVMATLPVLGHSLGFEPMLILPFIAVAVAAGVWVLFNAETLTGPIKHWRVIHWALHLIRGIRMIIKNPRACCSALSLALIGQVVYAVCAWVLARSLSIDMTLVQSLTLMPPVMLMTTLPISIGGWGVREMGVVGMLGLIGIPQAAALVLSIQLGLLAIFISLPGSLLWLNYRKLNPKP